MKVSNRRKRFYKRQCQHNLTSIGLKEVTGKNILGYMTKCKIENFLCILCNDKTFKFRGILEL